MCTSAEGNIIVEPWYKKQNNDDITVAVLGVWFVGILLIAVVSILFISTGAFAIPPLYVASVAFGGDDANDGTVNHPVFSESRVRELCSVGGQMADPCDTNLRWDKDDTPAQLSVDFLLQFSKQKQDKVERSEKKEVVPGHGQLPDVDEVESADNGWGIRQTFVWKIVDTKNGPQEYCSEVRNEVYSR